MLDDVARRTGAAAVLLGHTLDDQAETVLLGLARGSGARSLAGMAAVRGLYRRPLLGLRRTETEAVCTANGLTWWSDPTNGTSGAGRSAGDGGHTGPGPSSVEVLPCARRSAHGCSPSSRTCSVPVSPRPWPGPRTSSGRTPTCSTSSRSGCLRERGPPVPTNPPKRASRTATARTPLWCSTPRCSCPPRPRCAVGPCVPLPWKPGAPPVRSSRATSRPSTPWSPTGGARARPPARRPPRTALPWETLPTSRASPSHARTPPAEPAQE
ncbi:ATP-binding protein [Oerskovia sp. M15]